MLKKGALELAAPTARVHLLAIVVADRRVISNSARRGRVAQVLGAGVALAGLVVFLAAPRVTGLVLFPARGDLSLDSAVVIWGVGPLAGAPVMVAGPLTFVAAAGYLMGLRPRPPQTFGGAGIG
jgi:hypothetical protein